MQGSKEFTTVVIPTYNRKDILRKCLEAFSNQTYPRENWEIVAIDDGSTDGTKELLEESSRRISNLRHFSQPQGGPAKARNLGIKEAKGPVILLTGDDCIPDAKLLEEHNRSHQKEQNIAVLGHIDWHPDLEVTPFMKFLHLGAQFAFPTIKRFGPSVPYGFFYTSNISLSKRLLLDSGGFDEDFTHAVLEDAELGYRLWKTGMRIVYNSKAITYHYHPVNLENYVQRNYRLGLATALIYKKHPELQNNPVYLIKDVNNPQIAVDYYTAVLKYAAVCGLQKGLVEENSGKKTYPNFLPFKDRLRVWYNDNLLSLATRLREHKVVIEELQDYVKKLEEQVREAIPARDKLIEELNRKNMEKYYRIVELEKLECRVKSSLIFKIYNLLRKITGGKG